MPPRGASRAAATPLAAHDGRHDSGLLSKATARLGRVRVGVPLQIAPLGPEGRAPAQRLGAVLLPLERGLKDCGHRLVCQRSRLAPRGGTRAATGAGGVGGGDERQQRA
jgi:hypothetical protein